MKEVIKEMKTEDGQKTERLKPVIVEIGKPIHSCEGVGCVCANYDFSQPVGGEEEISTSACSSANATPSVTSASESESLWSNDTQMSEIESDESSGDESSGDSDGEKSTNNNNEQEILCKKLCEHCQVWCGTATKTCKECKKYLFPSLCQDTNGWYEWEERHQDTDSTQEEQTQGPATRKRDQTDKCGYEVLGGGKPPKKRMKKTTTSRNPKSTQKVKSKVVTKTRKIREPSCGQCEPCLKEDCGKCKCCLDMPKFGGPGKRKERCIHRKCLEKIEHKKEEKKEKVEKC